MNGARVCVIGDAMVDRFIAGEVERISPEAPIPVLRVTGETEMPGGAGNVVRSIAGLGGRAKLLAAAGRDDAAARLRELTSDITGVQARFIVDAARRTGVKTRYTAGGQQMLRADDETAGPLSPAAAKQFAAAVAGAARGAGAVVLSDYGKGALSETVIRKAIDAADKAGVPVVVDPKGADFSRYLGADVITPNRKELAEASGMAAETDEEVVAAARHVMRTAGVKAVLATRSKDGMTLVTSLKGAKGVSHFAAEALEVFDVSGAGDTAAAAVALALASGAALQDAAAVANVAAGVAVGKAGTAAVSAEEVSAALRRGDYSDAEAKMMSLEQLLTRADAWRRAGRKIGFTNGCFDLLHPGHVSLLAQAKAKCGRLVVGLNSDASTRRLKGRGRPVQNEAARARVLASLADADAVVVFNDDTPMEIIRALRPDVLVKGADYKKRDVVGAAYVERAGGKVFLAGLEAGHSTTETVAKMKKPLRKK
ncbi:MAG: D-glycero-beta-D-manno-heptose 1-phosphate adenylyltransferase [Rhodospirillales bacterium]